MTKKVDLTVEAIYYLHSLHFFLAKKKSPEGERECNYIVQLEAKKRLALSK